MTLSIKNIRFGATANTSIDDEIDDDGDGSGGTTCGIFNSIDTDYISTISIDINGALVSTSTGTIPASATTNLFTFSKGSFSSGFFKYVIVDECSECSRNGSVVSSWNSNGIAHTEVSSPDVGNTEDVELATCAVGESIYFYATNNGGTEWSYRTNYTLI